MFEIIRRKTIRHPADLLGEKRICPHTGEQFTYCWSEEEVYDVCDSCKTNGMSVSERLHELNEKRK